MKKTNKRKREKIKLKGIHKLKSFRHKKTNINVDTDIKSLWKISVKTFPS